jgi:hypothetical protein
VRGVVTEPTMLKEIAVPVMSKNGIDKCSGASGELVYT